MEALQAKSLASVLVFVYGEQAVGDSVGDGVSGLKSESETCGDGEKPPPSENGRERRYVYAHLHSCS